MPVPTPKTGTKQLLLQCHSVATTALMVMLTLRTGAQHLDVENFDAVFRCHIHCTTFD